MISNYDDLIANNHENLVTGTDRTDRLTVQNQILATGSEGLNRIETGSGNDMLHVGASVSALEQGSNQIIFGVGDNTLIVEGNLLADNGNNLVQFNTQDDDETLLSLGELSSSESGYNSIQLGDGFHYASVRGMQADGGSENRIEVSGRLELYVDGSVSATDSGINTLYAENSGAKIEITGDVLASAQGSNDFGLYGSNELWIAGTVSAIGGRNSFFVTDTTTLSSTTIEGGIYADQEGINYLYAYGGTATIGSDVISTGGSSNSITMQTGGVEGGGNHLSILGNMVAEMDSINTVSLSGHGPQTAWIEGGIESYSGGMNAFDLHDFDIDITINGSNGYAMLADGGSNEIGLRGEGNISLSGNIHAENGGMNSILSFQNAKVDVSLFGKVSEGGLDMELAGEYDVLTLKANDATQFGDYYQDWLGGLLAAEYGPGTEVIRVDTGSPTASGLDDLLWLDQLVDGYNAVGGEQIALELSIDQAVGSISLDDLFSTGRDDIFSGLDMSGDNSNTLEVFGSLSDNGMEGNFLRLLGDSNDSVALSDDWTLTQTDYVDVSGLSYSVYQNATDELLIQSTISVI